IASTGHSGSHSVQSMHSSGSITSMFGPSWKQSTGHTSTQSVYLHLMQASVTTNVMLEIPLGPDAKRAHCPTNRLEHPAAVRDGNAYRAGQRRRQGPCAGGGQICASGTVTRSPSSSSRTSIWQLNRLVGRRSITQSSMPSSWGSGGGSRSTHSGSTYTWQVAHEHAPPHSAMIPSTLLSTAASITV